MAKLLSGTRIYGNAIIDSNVTIGGFANITVTSGSTDSALVIMGNVARGGAGYHDFLRVTSTASSIVNPNMYFRLNSLGNLQIINSTYGSQLFELQQSGNIVVAGGISAGGVFGTSGQVLQSTGTGIQWAAPSAGTSISSGTSNVAVLSSGGSIATYVSGALIATASSTGLAVTGVVNASGNILSTGAIHNNVVVNSGNINAVGGYFIGNGAFLSGITASGGSSYTNVQVATYFASGTAAGYINTSGNVSAAVYTGGAVNVSGNILASSANIGTIFTTGNVGLGTVANDSRLTVALQNQINSANTALGTVVHTSGADSTISRITTDNYGTGVYVAYTGRHARGNTAVPTASQLGDILTQFTGRGYGATAFNTNSPARVDVGAIENFTDSAWGTNISIKTTTAGTTTLVERATFDSNGAVITGNVKISAFIANSTGNIGAVGQYLQSTATGFQWATVSGGGFAGNTSIYVSGTTTAIFNGGTTGVGNIGSATATFNTIFAKSTTAQYADLAEVYTSDKNYVPGTVLIFGGDQEVTISTLSHDPRIAGVVSTNPAYLMNNTESGVPVALQGRVPCQVLGPVEKGDRLVASQWPGIAQTLNLDLYEPGCVIGKALESITESSVKTIEVVVGRV
jgi:hypothetical protein